jgi:hypothetical protein
MCLSHALTRLSFASFLVVAAAGSLLAQVTAMPPSTAYADRSIVYGPVVDAPGDPTSGIVGAVPVDPNAATTPTDFPHLPSPFDPATPSNNPQTLPGEWSWQAVPRGLVFSPFLAGAKEPRMSGVLAYTREFGWIADGSLGARMGLIRFGSQDSIHPEGWQLDIEGAAFPRLILEHSRYLLSSEFRIGMPLTYHEGPWETKLGYYHMSSHMGDQYTLDHPVTPPVSNGRDAIVAALAYRFWEDFRVYSEAEWAFQLLGEAKPWQFQFGAEFSPMVANGSRGTPFAAVNGQIREDCDFGGNLTVQVGWQWRGTTGQLARTGFYYFNGKSLDGQFFNKSEELIGMGLWYDF